LKLNVKLYGTLSHSLDEYDHKNGIDMVVISGEEYIRDLVSCFDIKEERVGMVFIDNTPAGLDTRLKDGAMIKIFQPIFGG